MKFYSFLKMVHELILDPVGEVIAAFTKEHAPIGTPYFYLHKKKLNRVLAV